MAKTKKQQQELQETAQQIFLAGLGALSRAEEEGSKFFQKLVQRGQAYDGPGADQLDVLKHQVESAMMGLRDKAAKAQSEAESTAQKARKGVTEQLSKAKQGVGSVVETVEGRVESAVTAALGSLGVPTRAELEDLQKSLKQLARNLDEAKKERKIASASTPAVEAVATGGGWYEVRVHGLVVDKVRGDEAATARVEQLRAQDFPSSGSETPEVTIAATGGGWYEVLVDGVAVDKVQGRRAAEAAVKRIEQNG